MEPSTRPDPNKPNGLLAALVPFGVLVQPEVALTRSIWWLLGLEGAAGALDALVRRSGLEPGEHGVWLTEVVGEDRGRTDLEYRWGQPARTRVVVEAKLGHTLTREQVASYLTRLPERGGLLVLLVPEARKREGQQVVATLQGSDGTQCSRAGRVGFAIWTYDEVTTELERTLPGSPDVAQFRGLVEASQALDIYPFTEAELLDDNPTRRGDVWRVVDEASFGIFGAKLPSSGDATLEQRRYVDLAPYSVSLAVGVGRKVRVEDQSPQPWAWLRLDDSPSFSRFVFEVLEELHPGQAFRDRGAVWLPLQLPTEEPGSAMVEAVRRTIEKIGGALRHRLDVAVNCGLGPAPPELRHSMSAVLGVAALEAADTLDNSSRRQADISLLIREAVRPFYDGRLWPQRGDDDYLSNRWLPVRPLATFVAASMGRREQSANQEPQPWAWLRVHETTPHAETAYAALEALAPGRVVVDRHGRATPLVIPTGADGPAMLHAVHDQLTRAVAAVRAAVLQDHALREDE